MKQVVHNAAPFGWTAAAKPHTPGAGAVALAERSRSRAIEATVVIGTIKKNCSGHGICKVLVGAGTARDKCRTVRAWIGADANGYPCIAFRRGGICARLRESHFSGPSFLLEEEFVLPTWLDDQLELSDKRLVPGSYPLRAVPGYYLVSFGPAAR